MGHGEGDTSCNWCTWNDSQRIGKGTGRLRNPKTSRDPSDYSITKIGQNTELSPGDLKRLNVTQTPEKKTSAIVAVKNSQRNNNNNNNNNNNCYYYFKNTPSVMFFPSSLSVLGPSTIIIISIYY